jgi:hypothetical protein
MSLRSFSALALGLVLSSPALAETPSTSKREQILEAQRVVKACAPVLAKCRAAIGREALAIQRQLGELEAWQKLLAGADPSDPSYQQLTERIAQLKQQRQQLLAQAAEAPRPTAHRRWDEFRHLVAEALVHPPSAK